MADIRQQGMILAIELFKNPKTLEPFAPALRIGHRVYREALARGVILRPLGNVIYFMPPYVITPEEIEQMGRALIAGVHQATQDP